MSREEVVWNTIKKEMIHVEEHPRGVQITIYPAFDKSSEIVVPPEQIESLIAQIMAADQRAEHIWGVMRRDRQAARGREADE